MNRLRFRQFSPIIVIILFSNPAYSQMHFSEVQPVPQSNIEGGSTEMNNRIQQYFTESGSQLTYNIEWYGPNNDQARLSGGTHVIDQDWDITVGFLPLGSRIRPHNLHFDISLVENQSGEYAIQISWTMTDADSATTFSGKQSIGTVKRTSPGVIIKPTVLSYNSSSHSYKRIYRHNSSGSNAGGQWLSFTQWATRGYNRSDGAFVIEAYPITFQVFIPSQGSGNWQNR